MHYKAMFKGDYIAAVEFGAKQPTLTIASVKLCKLEQEDGRQKEKGIIAFKETERGWVLNRTNATCLAALFGDETDNWIGKRITLFSTMVQVGRAKESGIRVKGSPDISKPVTVEVKLPRRKPTSMRLEVTKAGRKPEPEPESKPPEDIPFESAEEEALRKAQELADRASEPPETTGGG
jgi:hypothetical protein